MAKAKKSGNKELLSKVNYSINLIKEIKDGKEFTKEEKQDIWDKYCSIEENNNGYYTPVEICKFMSDCLDIKEGSRIADLSAGIGNMVRPFIEEYGKLRENIIFDLYEYDENTSIALEKAWEDFDQVNVFGSVDTLTLNLDNKYDYILGNPPFTLKTDYCASWNVDKKGKKKKGLNILEAFIDKIMLSLKPGGTAAIVVASGIVFKGNATALLREHLKTNYNLKLAMQLDSETFESAGLAGTGVSTLLLIIEKKKTIDNKTIYVEIDRDDSFLEQLKSIAHHYRIANKEHFIQYNSSTSDLIYGILKEGINPEIIDQYDNNNNNKEYIGTCYCCNKEIEEYQVTGDYKLKDTKEDVLVCFECANDEYIYLSKIKSNLLIDGESYELTNSDKKHLKDLEKEHEIEIEQKRLESIDKNIYLFTNKQRQNTVGENSNHQLLTMCKDFQSANDDNIIKIKYPFIVDCKKHFENILGLEYIDISVDGLKIERDNQRHIYKGKIKTSWSLYDTSFSIFYYENNKKANVYVNYNFICSKSYSMKKLIIDNVLPDLLGDYIVLY